MCALSVCLFNKITSWKEEKGHEISNLNNLYFQQSHVKRWRCVNLTCQSHIIWHLFFFQFNDDVFLNGYFGAWFHLWFVCLFLPLSIALGKDNYREQKERKIEYTGWKISKSFEWLRKIASGNDKIHCEILLLEITFKMYKLWHFKIKLK